MTKKVICFGTFDILHLGHISYLEQAKQYGDYLIVVIARDSTKRAQEKITLFSEKERLDLVSQLRIVDETVLGDAKDHLKVIKEKQPEVICLGYDHKISVKELKKKLSAFGLHPEIHRTQAYKPEIYKSSKIKKEL